MSAIMFNFCKKDRFVDDLHLEQRRYTGNELQIDGYYFKTYNEGKSTIVYFLYENGIIQGGTSYGGANWEEKLQADIVSGEYHQSSLTRRHRWGLFQIQDSSILFEKWHPGTPGPEVPFASSGVILNDSTFWMKQRFKFENGKRTEVRDITEINDIYHFRQFSPKPDSSNPFIP